MVMPACRLSQHSREGRVKDRKQGKWQSVEGRETQN